MEEGKVSNASSKKLKYFIGGVSFILLIFAISIFMVTKSKGNSSQNKIESLLDAVKKPERVAIVPGEVFPDMTEEEMKSSKICKQVERYRKLEVYKGIFKVYQCYDSVFNEDKKSVFPGRTYVWVYKGRVVRVETNISADLEKRSKLIKKVISLYGIKNVDPSAPGEYSVLLSKDKNNFLYAGYLELNLIRNSSDYLDLDKMESNMVKKRNDPDSERN